MCKKNVQRRNYKTNIVRIVGQEQSENAKRSAPLFLFFGQTCPKAPADDDERLSSEMANVVATS